MLYSILNQPVDENTEKLEKEKALERLRLKVRGVGKMSEDKKEVITTWCKSPSPDPTSVLWDSQIIPGIPTYPKWSQTS